jgi:hypothetical protein
VHLDDPVPRAVWGRTVGAAVSVSGESRHAWEEIYRDPVANDWAKVPGGFFGTTTPAKEYAVRLDNQAAPPGTRGLFVRDVADRWLFGAGLPAGYSRHHVGAFGVGINNGLVPMPSSVLSITLPVGDWLLGYTAVFFFSPRLIPYTTTLEVTIATLSGTGVASQIGFLNNVADYSAVTRFAAGAPPVPPNPAIVTWDDTHGTILGTVAVTRGVRVVNNPIIVVPAGRGLQSPPLGTPTSGSVSLQNHHFWAVPLVWNDTGPAGVLPLLGPPGPPGQDFGGAGASSDFAFAFLPGAGADVAPGVREDEEWSDEEDQMYQETGGLPPGSIPFEITQPDVGEG